MSSHNESVRPQNNALVALGQSHCGLGGNALSVVAAAPDAAARSSW